MVALPSDVREVALGDAGVLGSLHEGGVYVDMTTSEPSLAQEIYEVASGARDSEYRRASIGRGRRRSQRHAGRSWVGGDAEAVARIRPLLELMGRTIVHQGPAGAGQHTKMVNQTLIATGTELRRLRGAALRLQGRA